MHPPSHTRPCQASPQASCYSTQYCFTETVVYNAFDGAVTLLSHRTADTDNNQLRLLVVIMT